jgi:hypothetical protein
MGLESNIPDCLKRLQRGEEDSGDLSEDFLSACEQDVAKLRAQKAQMLVHNAQIQNATFQLVSDMNVAEDQLLPLVKHSMRRRLATMPSWWNDSSADTVVRAVSSEGGVIRVGVSFNLHLMAIHESLASLAKSRRELSDKLRDLVERAQKTLLATVEGEIEVIEAYSSFHDALFRLPALSKERINSCTGEIDALLAGVEAMTQSEIEALSVVWETLNISSSDRGKFWGEVEDSMSALQSNPGGPVDKAVQLCAVDGEEWVLNTIKAATKSYRQLEARLFKLERIHKQVETLRSQQDAKSKMISLDSEIRILTSKLSEFEEKKCNKQRLLTKKTGSGNLLKEEKFRKQMQQKYTAKVEELAKLLQAWSGDNENRNMAANLLSDEVRMLLANPDNMNTWVEKRTEFMHLRTITKGSKRTAESAGHHERGSTPTRKRLALPTATKTSKRGTESAVRERGMTPPLKRAAHPTFATKTSTKRGTESASRERGMTPPSKRPTTSISRGGNTTNVPLPLKSTRATKRVPLSPARNTITTDESRNTSTTKRLTLPPFGHVFEQDSSPSSTKENAFD